MNDEAKKVIYREIQYDVTKSVLTHPNVIRFKEKNKHWNENGSYTDIQLIFVGLGTDFLKERCCEDDGAGSGMTKASRTPAGIYKLDGSSFGCRILVVGNLA